ncbi:MAG TPA: RHS repeat-associated core domain-containing protein [Anaerolineales bacterium]|nr:RHS repeat-associated core domain-containing protein [Anaerolineales bacterium]
MYRLTAADYSTGEFFHDAYDAVGNRLTQDTLAGTNTYAYDIANRLGEVDGVPYTWDANGNLLNDGASIYTHNHANRLVNVVQGPDNYEFRYNGLGDRVVQNTPGSGITYTLDLNTGLTQVLADGTNAFLYGTSRIGEEQPGGWQYHVGDALGSVRQLADSFAQVQGARTYEPFGSQLSSVGAASSAFAFTGEQVDGTGLTYLRARYYASDVGRFLSADPLPRAPRMGRPDTPWVYGLQNPVTNVDPTGLRPLRIWASAFIADQSITFPYVYYPKLWDPTYWEIVYNVPIGAVTLGEFDGDGRDFFDGGVRPSARVWHEVVVDSNPLVSASTSTSGTGKTRVAFIYFNPLLGQTGFGIAGAQAPSPPPAKVTLAPELCLLSVYIDIYDAPESGTMPLGVPILGITPPVRYRYSVEFDFAQGRVTYAGKHSGYPWHELYIQGLSQPPRRYEPDGLFGSGVDLYPWVTSDRVLAEESQEFEPDPVAEAICSCSLPSPEEE